MLISASATYAESRGDAAAAAAVAAGCAALVAGTALHAAVFVFSEATIRQSAIEPALLSVRGMVARGALRAFLWACKWVGIGHPCALARAA